ncbi:unnamed protein product [Dibothriocephalus latus]|uniref:RRM domain-containing protein n=1 Tax=Dibothriocephalus latus TaxID=60516 RepID=A0A3P6U5A2_DIBLA|nr:unnamed protein product [Dibothriocephalus latus]
MAEYLASIFGTEKDKYALSLLLMYLKELTAPFTSKSVLAAMNAVANMTEVQAQQLFDEFFEEVFVECEEKYGEIEEMNVCDNLGDHLVGNVYIKFRREEDAEKAVKMLNCRWFGGRPIHAELSPVTDFREACCRQYEVGTARLTGYIPSK